MYVYVSICDDNMVSGSSLYQMGIVRDVDFVIVVRYRAIKCTIWENGRLGFGSSMVPYDTYWGPMDWVEEVEFSVKNRITFEFNGVQLRGGPKGLRCNSDDR